MGILGLRRTQMVVLTNTKLDLYLRVSIKKLVQTIHRFSLFMKPVTVHTILTIVVTNSWPIKQIDVNNAFLNGHLEKEVYMQQPPGFESSNKDLACKLNKALYGLKQAPRAWFERLKTALIQHGFSASKCDPSLFMIRTSLTILVFVYVDDIIITENFLPHTQQLINKLISDFALKQLSDLIIFWVFR